MELRLCLGGERESEQGATASRKVMCVRRTPTAVTGSSARRISWTANRSLPTAPPRANCAAGRTRTAARAWSATTQTPSGASPRRRASRRAMCVRRTPTAVKGSSARRISWTANRSLPTAPPRASPANTTPTAAPGSAARARAAPSNAALTRNIRTPAARRGRPVSRACAKASPRSAQSDGDCAWGACCCADGSCSGGCCEAKTDCGSTGGTTVLPSTGVGPGAGGTSPWLGAAAVAAAAAALAGKRLRGDDGSGTPTE